MAMCHLKYICSSIRFNVHLWDLCSATSCEVKKKSNKKLWIGACSPFPQSSILLTVWASVPMSIKLLSHPGTGESVSVFTGSSHASQRATQLWSSPGTCSCHVLHVEYKHLSRWKQTIFTSFMPFINFLKWVWLSWKLWLIWILCKMISLLWSVT